MGHGLDFLSPASLGEDEPQVRPLFVDLRIYHSSPGVGRGVALNFNLDFASFLPVVRADE